jgi:hypothetical protein
VLDGAFRPLRFILALSLVWVYVVLDIGGCLSLQGLLLMAIATMTTARVRAPKEGSWE